MRLYRVDPETLARMPGIEAVASGVWIRGTTSPNGRWVLAHIVLDADGNDRALKVIEVESGRVVTEIGPPLPGGLDTWDLHIGDDGAVFGRLEGSGCAGRVGRLGRGEGDFEIVFDRFHQGFCPWTSMTLLDRGRVGWFGGIHADSGETEAAIVLGGLGDGSTTVIPLPDVALSLGLTHDLGDWIASDYLQPAVVWDPERNRVLVVHADQQRVSVVDLDTGDTTTRRWSEAGSWIDRLVAWWIPPTAAKGPDFGTIRSAVLSPSGDVLYVATDRADVVFAENGEWSIESVPQGVDVIDTETWQSIGRLDIPAGRVKISPDGLYLVTSGFVRIERLSTSALVPQDVFVVRADNLEVVGRLDPPGDWYPDIQFSADGRHAYLGQEHGGPITIVELASGEVVGRLNAARSVVFGPAAMLATSATR